MTPDVDPVVATRTPADLPEPSPEPVLDRDRSPLPSPEVEVEIGAPTYDPSIYADAELDQAGEDGPVRRSMRWLMAQSPTEPTTPELVPTPASDSTPTRSERTLERSVDQTDDHQLSALPPALSWAELEAEASARAEQDTSARLPMEPIADGPV
ncbi:MAG: hypothetical protein ABI232_04815, partial [Jatrophihabitantaceae bacterium]